jgi:glycerol-3-phosphate cytidylyltransferase
MGLRIYTGGTFDLIHAGHIAFLRRCAELGSVTVSLNTDEFIQEYKGVAPIMSFYEREAVLSELRCVDAVVANTGGANSTEAIEQVAPDLIVVGSDWARRDYYKQMNFDQDWLDARDIGLLYIPYTEGISTTDIKKRVVGKR